MSRYFLFAFLSVLPLAAQPAGSLKPARESAAVEPGWRDTAAAAKPGEYRVDAGTKVPVSFINSVSTKVSSEGERIYLETVFPILVNKKIVIPPGSWVTGTITQVKRPGRVKGRGEMYLRFDSLTLPNGVTRDFSAQVGSYDGRASEEFRKREGKIVSEGNKGADAATIAGTAAGGASVGSIAGAVSGNAGKGLGIGAGVGAAAGAMMVLLTRGPDIVLSRGTTLEMVLDNPLQFVEEDLDFSSAPASRHASDGPGPLPSKRGSSVPGGLGVPGRRF